MASPPRRIGILAGGGSLPREFADAAAKRGDFVQVVALGESAGRDFGSHNVVRVSMGQIGKILRTFQAANVDGIVIIGPVTRADIFRIRPDSGFFLNFPAILKIIRSGGDDSALSGVVRFFEAKGFRVLGPADVAPETLASQGAIAGAAAGDEHQSDIRRGFDLIRTLGPFDIGQAVVISGGQVEAIEGAEGTNVMLERIARRCLSRGSATARGVLVKRSKPGQELRVDTPSIGPGTVTRAANAGLAGIALEAQGVLIAERDAVALEAKRTGLFICGGRDEATEKKDALDVPQIVKPESAGGRAPTEEQANDALKGLRILQALKPYDCGKMVVVARDHVQAVEAGGEAPLEVLQRVETYRKRHGAKSLRRSGVAVISAALMDEALAAGAAAAGLTAVAVADLEPRDPRREGFSKTMERHGLTLLLGMPAKGI